MKLHDFQHALDNADKPNTESNFARACHFGNLLVRQGVISREVRIDGEAETVELHIAADDGWRWAYSWGLHMDPRWIDPLGNAPLKMHLLAASLGLIPSDFAEAVRLAATKLILNYEMDAPEDGGPRTPAERNWAIESAIKSIDDRVAKWLFSFERLESEGVRREG